MDKSDLEKELKRVEELLKQTELGYNQLLGQKVLLEKMIGEYKDQKEEK